MTHSVSGCFECADAARLIQLLCVARTVARSLLHQVLEAQAREQLHAECCERIDERQGYSNSYKPCQLKTHIGAPRLRMAHGREGRSSTDLFARFQWCEQALTPTLTGKWSMECRRLRWRALLRSYAAASSSRLQSLNSARCWIRCSQPVTNGA